MTADAPRDAAYPPSRQGYYVLAVLILAYIVSYIDRTMLTLLVDPIRATLKISDLQISLLHGFAFALFYTILGLPMGRIADRRSRRNLIFGGVLVWSLATSLCGFARNFWQMFAARVSVGVGEATLSPAAYSLLSDYFPPEERSRVLGIYTSGIYLGAGIATFGGGALIAFVPAITLPVLGHHEPWQVIFMLIGLLGIPVALMMLTVREPERHVAPVADAFNEVAIPLRTIARYMWERRGAYGALILGISCYAMMTNGLKGWIPTFLMRTYGWAPADVGVGFGLVLLTFGTIGTASGGFGAVWLRRRGQDHADVRLSLYAALAILPFAAVAPLMPTGGLALTVYAVVIFLAGVPFGVCATVVQQITPNRMRGQVSAIYLFWLNLAGIGTGPVIVALFTDQVFGNDAALRYSLGCLALVTVPLSALAFLMALRSLRKLPDQGDLA